MFAQNKSRARERLNIDVCVCVYITHTHICLVRSSWAPARPSVFSRVRAKSLYTSSAPPRPLPRHVPKRNKTPPNTSPWSDWQKELSVNPVSVGSFCKEIHACRSEEADDFIYFYFKDLKCCPCLSSFNKHIIFSEQLTPGFFLLIHLLYLEFKGENDVVIFQNYWHPSIKKSNLTKHRSHVGCCFFFFK